VFTSGVQQFFNGGQTERGSAILNTSDTERLPTKLLLVDAGALPEVFLGVSEAKRLLAAGEVTSAGEAARMAGISRSAFYKYRDAVFPYDAAQSGRILTIHAVLRDRPGMLSGVLLAFADAGANILTVNQNIPSGGKASITVSARIDLLNRPADVFLKELAEIDGVSRVEVVSYG